MILVSSEALRRLYRRFASALLSSVFFQTSWGKKCDTDEVIYNSRKWMGQEIALIPISNLAPSEVRDDARRVKQTSMKTSPLRASAPSSVQFSSLSGLLTAMGWG